MNTRLNKARSTAANAWREVACDELADTGQTACATRLPDAWWLISVHFAGVHSAYAVQTRLRKRYPELRFRVVNRAGDETEHNAEIHAIRAKERDENERA